jgi:hypothetical protein
MAKTARLLRVVLWCLAYSFVSGNGEAAGECTVLADGTTECVGETAPTSGRTAVLQNGANEARCRAPTSLYSYGGTAVAYRPNVRLQTNVCPTEKSSLSSRKYKVAHWFGRRTIWPTAPRLTVTVHVHACESSANSSCTCHQLPLDSLTSVEVWQTRPDGTYPSLRVAGNDDDNDDECRARQVGGSVTFETLAPGSVGSLHGLGPASWWEMGPYRPPVLHLLVTAAGSPPGSTADEKAALLVDIPLAVHPTTLEQTVFRGPDWSGPAWTRSNEQRRTEMYQISSWTAVPAEHRAMIVVDVFVPISWSSSTSTKKTENNNNNNAQLCPSLLYGTPRSFYTEPIAVCAPSLLHFFPL